MSARKCHGLVNLKSKVCDMFQIVIQRSYYQPMNNLFFNHEAQSTIRKYCNILKPKCHDPIIKHDFTEQMMYHRLIRLLRRID